MFRNIFYYNFKSILFCNVYMFLLIYLEIFGQPVIITRRERRTCILAMLESMKGIKKMKKDLRKQFFGRQWSTRGWSKSIIQHAPIELNSAARVANNFYWCISLLSDISGKIVHIVYKLLLFRVKTIKRKGHMNYNKPSLKMLFVACS